MSTIIRTARFSTTLRHRPALLALTTRPCLALSKVPGHFQNFHDSSQKKIIGDVRSQIPQVTTQHIPESVAAPQDISSTEFSSAHLKAYSASELLSYLIMGLCTVNKTILNLCIKVFPYVPIPVIKALVYKIYCGGETFDQVRKTGARLSDRGIHNMMLSLTIEACDGNDKVDPVSIVSQTRQSVRDILIPHTESIINTSGKDINSIPPGYVALKPTGFSHDAANVLRYYNANPKYAAMFDELVERASSICQEIYDANSKFALKYPNRTAPLVVGVIDAEKHDLQEGVYELQRRLYAKFNPKNKPVSVVGTLQMYLAGSSDLLAMEERLAAEHGYRLGLKLVRGAYIHSEKDRSVIHKTKEDTDKNYNQGITYCLESILAHQGNTSVIGHLVVASHNAESLSLTTRKLAEPVYASNSNKSNIVLGQLMGMADNITYNLIKEYKIDNVIKYVPWGPPLETKHYLLRRLEENGDAVKSDNGFPLVKAVVSEMMARFKSVLL